MVAPSLLGATASAGRGGDDDDGGGAGAATGSARGPVRAAGPQAVRPDAALIAMPARPKHVCAVFMRLGAWARSYSVQAEKPRDAENDSERTEISAPATDTAGLRWGASVPDEGFFVTTAFRRCGLFSRFASPPRWE